MTAPFHVDDQWLPLSDDDRRQSRKVRRSGSVIGRVIDCTQRRAGATVGKPSYDAEAYTFGQFRRVGQYEDFNTAVSAVLLGAVRLGAK